MAAAWLGFSALDAPGRLPLAVAQDCVGDVASEAGDGEGRGVAAGTAKVAAARAAREDLDLAPRLVAEWRVGAYRVRIFAGELDQLLTLERDGVLVHQQRGESFRLATVREGDRLRRLAPGRDLTGDGSADLAISERTGGAHCTQRVWIFELGSAVHRLPPIDAAQDDVAFFEDVDGDGRLEFRTHDWTFANWRTAFAFSPAPEVVLSASAGVLRPIRSLAPWPEWDVEDQITEIKAEPDWTEGEPPPALWGAMLDWIYAGCPEQAWILLARAWPVDTPGRDAFEAAFREQLARSPYWSDLAQRLK